MTDRSTGHSSYANREELEREIMRKVRRMLGYDPVGMTDLLHMLVHPDLIALTKEYVEVSSSCS